jgi:Ca2+-binding RTX toxin-like protein
LIVGLDGFQDDGEAGDNDFACDDIERLIGGGANDKLGGGAGALDQSIYGGPGNDTIYGGGGTDALFGEAGNDRLGGGEGDDYIEGGAGHDALYGNEGVDQLLGLAGNDNLFSDGDGLKDTVIGGLGSDSADADELDDLTGVESLI